MLKEQEFRQRDDVPMRNIQDLTAKETVDWLVEYHGLPKDSADTVRMNLESQYGWHNLRGRVMAGKFPTTIFSAILAAQIVSFLTLLIVLLMK